MVSDWTKVWSGTLLLKPKTQDMYESVLRARILPEFGERTLDSISRLDVQRWVVALGTEASPSHVRNCHSVLRRLLGDAVIYGLLDSNPADGVRLPKRPEIQKRPLSLDEVRLVAAETGRYEPFVLTLAVLGLRWAEAVGLRADDVQDGYVTIGSTLSEINGRFARVPTKNGRIRRLPIPPAISEHLQPPFTTTHGNPIRGNGFREKVWYPSLRRAGLRRVNPHSLRATAASELVKAGGSVVLVSKWLGHSQVSTTLKHYSFLFDNDLEQLSRVLGQNDSLVVH